MASGGDWTLDDNTIARLATVVSTKHMVTIAESYMKIRHETIENIQHDMRDDAEAINREILRTWRNSYFGPDQRQVSGSHCLSLYESQVKTRMHSSRMRTVRCSSHLLGVSAPCGQNDRQV